MTDINIELFKRYQPAKKIDIIKSLSNAELLAVTTNTVKRIIKEVGGRCYKSRDKRLYIGRDRRTGNNWNSVFEAIELCKDKLYAILYVQMDSTDTSIIKDYSSFFGRGDYRATAYETNRYGDSVPHYAVYDEEDKARCLRSVLLEYVHCKYHV